MAKRKPKPIIEPLDGPTPEQLGRGTYERGDFIHAESAQRVTIHINRGGTPLARWIAECKLSDTQQRAISHCLYLWRMAGTERRITSNYGERIPGEADSERRVANEVEARQDLHRIQDYIPEGYWNCFENCIRFDEPAGIAGSKLGFGSRSAHDRAHQVCCFVADLIAMKERL